MKINRLANFTRAISLLTVILTFMIIPVVRAQDIGARPNKQIAAQVTPLLEKHLELPVNEEGYTSIQLLTIIQQQLKLNVVTVLDPSAFLVKMKLSAFTLREILDALATTNHTSWTTSENTIIFKRRPLSAAVADLNNRGRLRYIRACEVALNNLDSLDQNQRKMLVEQGYFPWEILSLEQQALLRTNDVGWNMPLVDGKPLVDLPQDKLYFTGGFYVKMSIQFEDIPEIDFVLYRHYIQKTLSVLSPLKERLPHQDAAPKSQKAAIKAEPSFPDGVIRLPNRPVPIYAMSELTKAIKDAGRENVKTIGDIAFVPVWFSYNKDELTHKMTVGRMMELLAAVTAGRWDSYSQLSYPYPPKNAADADFTKVLLQEQKNVAAHMTKTARTYWQLSPVSSPHLPNDNSLPYSNPYRQNQDNYSWVSQLPPLFTTFEKNNPTPFFPWKEIPQEWQNVIKRGIRIQAEDKSFSYTKSTTREQAQKMAEVRSARLARKLWEPHGMENAKVSFKLGIVANVTDMHYSWGIE